MFFSKKPSKKQILQSINDIEKDPDSKEKAFGDISIKIIGGGLGALGAATDAAAVG